MSEEITFRAVLARVEQAHHTLHLNGGVLAKSAILVDQNTYANLCAGITSWCHTKIVEGDTFMGFKVYRVQSDKPLLRVMVDI